jgi:hypothetical protein
MSLPFQYNFCTMAKAFQCSYQKFWIYSLLENCHNLILINEMKAFLWSTKLFFMFCSDILSIICMCTPTHSHMRMNQCRFLPHCMITVNRLSHLIHIWKRSQNVSKYRPHDFLRNDLCLAPPQNLDWTMEEVENKLD